MIFVKHVLVSRKHKREILLALTKAVAAASDLRGLLSISGVYI